MISPSWRTLPGMKPSVLKVTCAARRRGGAGPGGPGLPSIRRRSAQPCRLRRAAPRSAALQGSRRCGVLSHLVDAHVWLLDQLPRALAREHRLAQRRAERSARALGLGGVEHLGRWRDGERLGWKGWRGTLTQRRCVGRLRRAAEEKRVGRSGRAGRGTQVAGTRAAAPRTLHIHPSLRPSHATRTTPPRSLQR